jgi:hypothetical protein
LRKQQADEKHFEFLTLNLFLKKRCQISCILIEAQGHIMLVAFFAAFSLFAIEM